jgi:hypothetical protein
MLGSGNEVLGAVDHPVAAIADCLAFHAPHVGPSVRFGHGQSVHFLAAHSREQVFFLLLAFTGHKDVLRSAEKMVERHGPAAKLALHQREIEVAKTRSADAFREIAGIKTEVDTFLLEFFPKLMGHLTGLLHHLLVWVDFIFNERPYGGHDHLLFFGQAKMHRRRLS